MTTNANTTTQTAAVAEPGAHVAPEKATSKRKASKKQSAPKAKKTASKPAAKKDAKNPASKKATKPATKKATASSPREGSKKQIVLDLLHRRGGATMAEIAKATGWQNHSIRGDRKSVV